MTERLRYVGYGLSFLENGKEYTVNFSASERGYLVQIDGFPEALYNSYNKLYEDWRPVADRSSIPNAFKYLGKHVDAVLNFLKPAVYDAEPPSYTKGAMNFPFEQNNRASTSSPDAVERPAPKGFDSPYNFQQYVGSVMKRYSAYYSGEILQHIKRVEPAYTEEEWNADMGAMEGHAFGFTYIIQQYLAGDIVKATESFNNVMDWLDLHSLASITRISKGQIFYRARVAGNSQLSREELFHIGFESRQYASTSRYSIPGLPALYLGSSVSVCWEEYDRQDIQKMHFSKFSNRHDIRILKIQRVEDF